MAYVVGLVLYIRSLGFWRGYSGFIMFIEGFTNGAQKVVRRFTEGSWVYRRFIFDEGHPDPCDCFYF